MMLQNSISSCALEFNKWIIKVGDGSIPVHQVSNDDNESTQIVILNDFLIHPFVDLDK